MYCERLTTFDRDEPKFRKAVKDFGNSSAYEVLATMDDFEFDWLHDMEEDQLFARYDFKPLKHIQRPYVLFQIHAGPKRKHLGYRAVLLFYDRQSHAGWVYAFKKDKSKYGKDVTLLVRHMLAGYMRLRKTLSVSFRKLALQWREQMSTGTRSTR